jgi:molybdopterin-containing oxidoreductase family iron-sulfur binding subunit
MNRRTFLKMAGMGSLSFAAGCTSEPEKTLYSLVHAPDDMVTGKATWYASTCRECPAGCGVLAKNREGRIVKVEGNPLHPINKGRLCMRGQAALQGIYNPDRIKAPMLKQKDGWRPLSFPQAEALLKERGEGAAQKGENKVRMLTEAVGESLSSLFTESLRQWRSDDLLVFEPYAYESLKTANQRIFGVDGLASYRMEEADLLVSFGADFLETWLSPVEYARKFKEMHALRGREKPLFFHVSPYQSMTCANADLWLSCKPDGEVAIALGLIKEAIQRDRGKGLPQEIRASAEKIASPYTKERVAQFSGVATDLYEKLLFHLLKSRSPLLLGGGTGATGANALHTEMAVNLLNWILDPDLTLIDFNNRHRVEMASKRSEVSGFFHNLEKEPADLLLLNNVNPVFALPPAVGVRDILERDSLFVASFSNFMDETTKLADLILPVKLPLETWDEYGGKKTIVSTLQPAMGHLTNAPHVGDVFLRAAFGNNKPAKNFQAYLLIQLIMNGRIKDELAWLKTLQRGGIFDFPSQQKPASRWTLSDTVVTSLDSLESTKESEFALIAAPSIRFFDGRGANRPWLCEVPDPLSKVAWQTTVLMHPQTLARKGLQQGDLVRIESKWGGLEAPVYQTEGVRVGVLVMSIGQGHNTFPCSPGEDRRIRKAGPHRR